MKVKYAVSLGIISWIIIIILSYIFKPYFVKSLPYIDLTVPLTIILVTLLTGTFYIRQIDENEAFEGFLVGIVFSIIHIIGDYLIYVLPGNSNYYISDFLIHNEIVIILIILITTSLGYLAQMKLELQ